LAKVTTDEERRNVGSNEAFKPLLGLYVAIFAGYGVASPFLPSLFADRGLSSPQIGVVLGLGSGCRLFAGPVGGWVADRTGASPVVLSVGLAAASVAALGFTVADGLLPFALIMLAYASLLAPLTPIADALAISAGKQGGGLRLYGWVRGTGSGAFILGSAIAGQVVGAFGNAIVVWMQCALLLVSAVFAWRGQSALAVRSGRTAESVQPLELVRLPLFVPLMLVAALIGGSHAMHDGFEVIRWRSAGMGPGTAGILWAESVSAEVVVLLALGPWLIDRIGVSGAAMISGASGVVRWGTAGLTANAPVMAMVEPLHGFTFALLHLVCMRVLGDIVPARLAATAQNVYGSVIVGGAVTMMTFVSGPLYDHFGAKAFWFMAALCAAAIPLSAKLKVSSSPG
jgi:MFS transporter, PPP family, 3-phenylpropionic acid transporter